MSLQGAKAHTLMWTQWILVEFLLVAGNKAVIVLEEFSIDIYKVSL